MATLMALLPAIGTMATGVVNAAGQYAQGKTQEAAIKQANLDQKHEAMIKRADLSREGMAASEEAERLRDTGEFPTAIMGLFQRNLEQKQQDIGAAAQDVKNYSKHQSFALNQKARAAGNTTPGQLATLFTAGANAIGKLPNYG